jgi:hypothetical protein
LCLVLMALLLLTLTGSISADDPAPAEIWWYSVEDQKCAHLWWDKDGTPGPYWLAEMKVSANDRNGNLLFQCKGTIDYEQYATIEQACEFVKGPPLFVDVCNQNHTGVLSWSGRQIGKPIQHRENGTLLGCTYNWSVVRTPSGNVEIRAEFTPASTLLPGEDGCPAS